MVGAHGLPIHAQPLLCGGAFRVAVDHLLQGAMIGALILPLILLSCPLDTADLDDSFYRLEDRIGQIVENRDTYGP